MKYKVSFFFLLVACNELAVLDSTFGVGGIVNTLLGAADVARAVLIQSDGALVITGVSNNSTTERIVTARYTSLGILDITFNLTGSRITQIGSKSEGNAVSIQSNGRIVSSGFAFQNRSNFALIRYTPLGLLDSEFNSTGIVTSQIGEGNQANAVAIQVDESLNENIIVAGSALVNGIAQFALVRYTPLGVLDTSFGTNGVVLTSIGFNAVIHAIGIQSDGKIIAGGYTNPGDINKFTVVRYNPDGSLDSAFGLGGIVTTNIGSDSFIYDIILQSDGKIVAVGTTREARVNKFAVVRYNADGALDTTFNSTGIQVSLIQNRSEARAVGIQSSGRIIVGGSTLGDGVEQFVLAGYTSTGILDTSFGTNGIELTTIGMNAGINGLVIQPDDKIVATGFSDGEITLARYLDS